MFQVDLFVRLVYKFFNFAQMSIKLGDLVQQGVLVFSRARNVGRTWRRGGFKEETIRFEIIFREFFQGFHRIVHRGGENC